MSKGLVRNRLVRGIGVASVLAGLTVLAGGATVTPALADLVCSGDLCVVGDVVDTPAGAVTVTVSAGNVVTVVLTPARATWLFGNPFATPPGPPTLPGCPGGCARSRTSVTTSAGVIDIDAIVIPPGPPGRFVLPNLVVVSIHPPGPCRVRTVGMTVMFTPIVAPVAGP